MQVHDESQVASSSCASVMDTNLRQCLCERISLSFCLILLPYLVEYVSFYLPHLGGASLPGAVGLVFKIDFSEVVYT